MALIGITTITIKLDDLEDTSTLIIDTISMITRGNQPVKWLRSKVDIMMTIDIVTFDLCIVCFLTAINFAKCMHSI